MSVPEGAPGPGNGAGNVEGGSGLRKLLATILSASVFGVAFTDDPVGFIQAVVLKWFVETVLGGGAVVAANILDLWDIFVEDMVVPFGVALVDPLGPIGDLLLEGVRGAGDVVAAIAGALPAPLSWLAAIAVWGLMFYAVVWGGVWAAKRLPKLLVWGLPWL
jgi:hypothetical protein